MSIGIEITLILGELMGDMALPIMRKQCKEVGSSPETLTLEQAEELLPRLEKLLRGFYGDKVVEDVLHRIKVVIANEKYRSRGVSNE